MEGDFTRALLITANVGSIFEDPDHMLKLWLGEFLKTMKHYQPGFVALHCQEVGGKNYEASMQHVNEFVKSILAAEELQKYDRGRFFLDEDYTAADKFTALGNLYFVHESVENVSIWDFIDCKFIPVEGREVLSGNIENVQIKEKSKFPQHFFPEFKWSRKGFLRTRWNINNCVFDLVNIHLFHDASNIIAMQSSPSLYCSNRQQALMHTLDRFKEDQYESVPHFIFGDFNFRLDTRSLVQELTAKTVSHQTKGKKDQVSKIVYTEEGNGKVVLTVEQKYFDHHDKHLDVFLKANKWLQNFDKETTAFKERLCEYEINFPPSYPFSEDIKDGMSYMKTRCPSWCDRILLSKQAKEILVHDDKQQPKYEVFGREVCMGDHKPVCLFACLRPGKGNMERGNPIISRKRTLSISINGEDIFSPDLAEINIHDYAHFQDNNKLFPGFVASIKRKSESQGKSMGKTPSFQNVATQVLAMEKVLLRWPKRPLARHHSSSSEDGLDTDDDSIASSKNGRDYACDSPENANGCIDGDVQISVATELTKAKTTIPQMEHENVSVENVHAVGTNSVPPGCDSNKSSTPAVTAPELAQLPSANEVIIPSTQVKISQVDTTKYIHIRQNGTSTRIFRETSV
ncbi:hypothetical protein ScPMuIL_006667 [Solemya velum]